MQTTTYSQLDETIHTEVLDNGLKICLLPRSGVSKIYGAFTTKYGAKDITFIPRGKSDKITSPLGVAHFLEHKMFDKGDHDVFADFSRIGGNCNAYTNPTQTSYLFTATENREENVKLLLDFVQDPYFTDQTVEKEKSIITQEAQMYKDHQGQSLYMGTLEAMFYHHPIKNEVLGTIASINNMTKEDLYTCYHTFYHPSNMTLCISGNFEAEEMLELIKMNQAGKEFAVPQPITRFSTEEPVEVAEQFKNLTMPVSTPSCMVGIKEYSQNLDREEYKKRVLITEMILDYLFGRSGPFYQQLYEQGLIDYTFSTETSNEMEYGYSLIGGNTNQPELFAKTVKKLLLSTKTYQFQAIEFERMKKRKIGHFLRQLNSIEIIAENYTWYEHRDLDYFNIISEINQLTLDDANIFMKNWIREERLSVCTISSK